MLTDQPAQLEQGVLLDVVAPPKSDSKKLPAAPIPAAPGSMQQRRALPDQQDASLANHTVEVPLQQVGHLFVAMVKLNGEQDARLIVDTGASHSIVSHRLAVELGLFRFQHGNRHDEYCGWAGSSPIGSNQVDSLGGG